MFRTSWLMIWFFWKKINRGRYVLSTNFTGIPISKLKHLIVSYLKQNREYEFIIWNCCFDSINNTKYV